MTGGQIGIIAMLMNRENGFTLIELIVALAVLAVLTALAVPSFRETMQNNRLVTRSNDIVTALNLARSEAIKRGEVVNVSANGANWNSGILVRTASGTDIRVFPAFTGNITVTAALTTISFQPNGTASTFTTTFATTFSVCDSSRTGETGRTVNVNAIGRISTTKLVCS